MFKETVYVRKNCHYFFVHALLTGMRSMVNKSHCYLKYISAQQGMVAVVAGGDAGPI